MSPATDRAADAGSSSERPRARSRIRLIARTVLFSLRAWTARIDSPQFWRLTYWLLQRPATVRVTAALCRRVARRVGGEITPEEVAERLSHLFLTGWPHHRGTPWINLHVARFTWKVKRALADSPSPVQRPPREAERLRVGLLANLGSTLTFTPQFFERIPENVELAAFDLGGHDRTAGYLERFVSDYEAFDAADTHAAAAAIERNDLDLLLFDVYKTDLDAILDRVSVPCIVDVCSTVKLRFHPSVSFHLYCLQQADYLGKGDGLFCATSESDLVERPVYPGALLFDRRNLDPGTRRLWRERDPLLVYHGKLYKLSDAYLEAVLSLLADDSSLELAVMGRDDGQLDGVRAVAERYGVADRLHYEGEFRVSRNEQGKVDDASWLRLADLLGRARLAPDPWPLGGAYSRLEAFAAGALSVHMGIRTDERAGAGRSSPSPPTIPRSRLRRSRHIQSTSMSRSRGERCTTKRSRTRSQQSRRNARSSSRTAPHSGRRSSSAIATGSRRPEERRQGASEG